MKLQLSIGMLSLALLTACGGGGGGGSSSNPAPVNPTPVSPAPVDPAPVDPAPVDPAPVDPAPVDPAPVDPAPVDPAPVDPAPVDPAPVDPAPVDPAPVDPAPVDPAPAAPAIFNKATLTNEVRLTAASHTSAGTDFPLGNGDPNFTGSMGAPVLSYKGYQYAAYYSARDRGSADNRFSEVIVARRSIDPIGAWEHSVLPRYQVTSEDAHNRIEMSISEGNGVIHLAFDHHNHDGVNYASSAVGVADNAAFTNWNNSIFTHQLGLGIGNPTQFRVTYPEFSAFPGGNLILYMRHGHANGGQMLLSRYDADNDVWASSNLITSRDGTFNGNESERGVYIADGMKVSPNGDLHVAWVFREEPVNCNPGTRTGLDCNHGLYYAVSKDEGQTWLNANGNKIADVPIDDEITVEDADLEVVPIPTALRPSNVSISSALDPETGLMHVLIAHKTTASGPTRIHHYYDTADGSWAGGESSFDASNVEVVFNGDQMFAFAGRGDAEIYYSLREENFATWRQIALPPVGGSPTVINNGYSTWDTSRLNEGVVSVMWHRPAPNIGDDTPIDAYTFTLTEAAEE